ncbi:MAG: TylF/MycF family methyltransferase [Helicobacteraceae bacterium]|nr:TylF/MycF family methyltransferase [Helicobacteraceae bacterium]
MKLYQIARLLRNALSSHVGRKHDALRIFADLLFPDYRLTWADWDWWKDKDFNDYLDRFGERVGLNTHRKWTLKQLLRLTASIEGDTAECGVFKGASSYLICASNDKLAQAKGERRTHHIFDSFEGVSAPSEGDNDYWTKGDLCASEETARENLSEFIDRVRFYKGWIPTRFEEVKDRRFCFVHIDVDMHDPTRDSIAFFYDRTNTGGIILCDDYGSPFCPGATKACDDFLADKPEKAIVLADGGAFIIKGVKTD